MRSRARQVRRLAHWLGVHTAVRVEACYRYPPRGGAGRWHLQWTDGPTDATMRILVTRRRHQLPDVDIAALCYDRSSTPVAAEMALSVWSAQHPTSYHHDDLAQLAHQLTDYPEYLAPVNTHQNGPDGHEPRTPPVAPGAAETTHSSRAPSALHSMPAHLSAEVGR